MGDFWGDFGCFFPRFFWNFGFQNFEKLESKKNMEMWFKNPKFQDFFNNYYENLDFGDISGLGGKYHRNLKFS